MPRSRRRHHSRSRSRSHSHERDRDAKRRKIDSLESLTHKSSVSSESSSSSSPPSPLNETTSKSTPLSSSSSSPTPTSSFSKEINDNLENKNNEELVGVIKEKELNIRNKKINDIEKNKNRVLSPKQLAKKLEIEQRKQEKQKERELREEQKRKEYEEKELKRKKKEEEKLRKQLELEEKNKEKLKEKELKDELKRKEREEKALKRQEKEEEKMRKQLELEEKNKEKLKLIEKKQKESAAFVNFFVQKKVDDNKSTTNNDNSVTLSLKFMPFEIKSDMRLAPILRRKAMTDDEKQLLTNYINNSNDNNANYIKDLMSGKILVGKCFKTWPFEEVDDDDDDDVIIVDEDRFGESICEDTEKSKKMRVKFLKFHENRRPPYYGTWRKKSNLIKANKPFIEDTNLFDYEIDSDDDWEEEEQGESLNGSEDEEDDDKDQVENDDYEVDNEFFVPHGHLSDDELDELPTNNISPELLKEKLKLLKDEFDHDMQLKTQKLKPRSIGCIWYNKNGSNVDQAIDKHLQLYSMITNGQIIIKKSDTNINDSNDNKTHLVKKCKELPQDLIPIFLKFIHGNNIEKRVIVGNFKNYLEENSYEIDISKAKLLKLLKQYAEYKKCTETGPLFNKCCWIVHQNVREQYNLDV